MEWNDVRHFLALARSGSVRAEGDALGVSHSTVARRVEALECGLGVRLFDRHRDGYQLTSAGEQMVPGAERVEREMAAMERSVAGQDARPEGPVRVTCTDVFVGRILVQVLAELGERHPGLEVQLDAESRNLDLSKREADLALRARVRDRGDGSANSPSCRGAAGRWVARKRTLGRKGAPCARAARRRKVETLSIPAKESP